MELKSAEREVEELQTLYARLRQHSPQLEKTLPALQLPTSDNEDKTNNNDKFESTKDALLALESSRERLQALQDQMEKFEKRRVEKDPVTEKLRYGAQTLSRVEAVLSKYTELNSNLSNAFEEQDGENCDSCSRTTTPTALVESIREEVAREEEMTRKADELEKERLLREEQERKAEEALRIEREKWEREEAARAEERLRVELARQAEEARQAQQRAREDAERADREWVQRINAGADGVREQLLILVESTANDPSAQMTAITSLHTLFSQIAAHPEEPSFRRIRRDHPKFNADIGRHPGGREILIAAGFELGSIDDVPSFISKEPNIEKDMDGWAKWFDLLKTSLEVIEEQLLK